MAPSLKGFSMNYAENKKVLADVSLLICPNGEISLEAEFLLFAFVRCSRSSSAGTRSMVRSLELRNQQDENFFPRTRNKCTERNFPPKIDFNGNKLSAVSRRIVCGGGGRSEDELTLEIAKGEERKVSLNVIKFQ